MKLLSIIVYLKCLLFSFILINNVVRDINCEQLSTVFVLETSDSLAAEGTNTEISTSGSAAKSLNVEDSKVITDNTEPFLAQQSQSTTQEKHNQHNDNINKSHVIVHNSDNNNNNNKKDHHQSTSSPSSSSKVLNHHTTNTHTPSQSTTTTHSIGNGAHTNHPTQSHQATARKLEENSNLAPPNHNQNPSATNHHHNSQPAHHNNNINNNNNLHTTNAPVHHAQQLHNQQQQQHQQQHSPPVNHQPPSGSSSSTHNQPDHHLKPATRGTATHNNNSQLANNHSTTHKPKQSAATTTQPGREESGTQKSEENRLLIEITSGNDDDNAGNSDSNKPIKNNNNNNVIGISTSGLDGASLGHIVGSDGKRTKPTIKLVISTGNSKNHNKPSISIIEPSDDGPPVVYTESSSGSNNNGYHPSTQTQKPIAFVNTNNYNNLADNNNYQPSVNQPLAGNGNGNSNYQNGRETADETPFKPNTNDYYDKESTTHRPASPVTFPPVVVTESYGNNNNNYADNNNPDNQYPSTINQNAHNNNNNNNSNQGNSLYPLNEENCGLQFEKTRIVGGEEANPDDFLWMAAIIKSKPNSETEVRPFCGGSLITRRHILTAAHCLENLAPRDVLVRLGSYDFDDATASSLSADYAIDQFRVPASYSKKSHMADIAIMRLKTPLTSFDNYKTVCMPQARRAYVGAQATVTGYGSQSQQFKRASPKLRQVTVPIWENRRCSAIYKRNFTDPYLCAGYEEGGRDACQGDSGGPLMTLGPNEKMMVVGVVSFGIGCGQPGYPGVYTRVTNYLDWIARNTKE